MGILLNVFETSLSGLKVWRLQIFASPKIIFQKMREFSYNRIAEGSFFDGFLFFKGDPEQVINELEKVNNQLERVSFIRDSLEEITLTPQNDGKLLKNLLYSLFEGELYRRGFIAPISKNKRALPDPVTYQTHKELFVKLNDDIGVLYGLRYMFEVCPRNVVRLWLDLYTPLWWVTEKRRLNRKEIREIDITLSELYTHKAILHPKERYRKVLKIIDILFPGEAIELKFSDGNLVSFSKDMYAILESGEAHATSFSYNVLDEPYLRFKYAISKNPRDVIRHKPYVFRASSRDIHVKVIIDKAIKNEFFNFFKKLRDGYAGNYITWPGLRALTGAELSLSDSDIISLDSQDYIYEDALKKIMTVSSERDKNVVIFFVVPRLMGKFYYKIKALALQKQVPVQFLLKDTLTKEPLEFTLMNIGVALIAKLGGIPWILRNPLTQTNSLFVGIAFHVDHESKDIYYGVVEVFDKFGKQLECKIKMYKSLSRIHSIRGLYIPKKDMENILEDLIEKYEPREIIFHKSATFHKEEKEAIGNICRRKNIQYALVHIERSNPYRVYGVNNEGYVISPLRGTVVLDKYNMNRAILLTTGIVMLDGKLRMWHDLGTPRPLEIMIEENTTRYSIREISEQVLALTKLDWNTTEISLRVPITLKYSNKAAKLAPYLNLKDIASSGLLEISDVRFLI